MYTNVLKSIWNGQYSLETAFWPPNLLINYRPQRSCGKVMYVFTPVCHSVHRRGVYPSMHLGRHPPGIQPLGRQPPSSRRLLHRTVRIPLECILVLKLIQRSDCYDYHLAKKKSKKLLRISRNTFCFIILEIWWILLAPLCQPFGSTFLGDV